MNSRFWRRAICFALVLLLTSPRLADLPTAYASSQTYYVSYSSGNDSNDGLSASTPWKTLGKVSSRTFGAGDSILLKKGDAWTGETLYLNGNGTSSNWISLSSYGTGTAKPIITPYTSVAAIPAANPTDLAANGLLYAIYLHNAAGWKISGLEIGYAKSGIVYVNDTNGSRDGLWIEDCYIHDIVKWPMNPFPSADNRLSSLQIMSYSVGIYTHLDESSPSNQRLKNVTVKNVTIERTDGPLEIRKADNVSIEGIHANESYREGIQLTGINVGYAGTPVGLLKDSVILNSGISGMAWGTAGLQFNAVENFVADNVEVGYTQSPNGIDYEGLNKNVTVQNSYIHDNADEAVMVYRNPQWSGGVENVNTSLINNVFQNNGINNDGNPHAAFLVQQYNYTNGGTVSGNTIIKTSRAQSLNMIVERTPQFNEYWPTGSYSLSNNTVKLPNGNILNYASTGFSGTQGKNGWTYRQFNGSTISDLAWNNANQTWQGSETFLLVGEDWMHPATGYATERIWTAPASENIRITGNPKKSDSALGNGVITSIWKNGTQIWAQAVTTTAGVRHDMQVSVNTGDTIAFVLDPNGDSSYDKTTWNPVIEEIKQTSFTADADFGPQQGMYGWRYVENNGSEETNMTWNGASGVWSGSVTNLLIGSDWQHPAIGIQSQRKWIAPSSGTVRITGSVRKYDSASGNGVIASIWKNGAKIWGDTSVTTLTGTSHDFTETVTAGDTLYFKIDANGEPSNDKTYWNPTISLAPSFSFDEMMSPYWSGTSMSNESVQMISSDGLDAEAPLLFHPTGTITVRNAQLGTAYAQGTDWTYDAVSNKIKLTSVTSATYMDSSSFYPATPPSGCFTVPKVGGGNVLGCEGEFFHDRQLAVSYPHNPNVWPGSFPAYQGGNLPRTIAKLTAGQPLGLTLYGDSISVGHSASGVEGAAPGLPNWGTLAMVKLQANYGSNLTFRNPSVSGQTSAWGASNVHALVSANHPDLVIIAFGMNDGTGGVAPAAFKNNVQAIIDDVRATNANAEFILVAPTLANPETAYAGNQADYKAILQQLVASGTVLMDMTGLHQTLLGGKRFQDMTGNNVNHPNDFLVRAYAQSMSALLIP
ncbi:SGNH/GDSL hydrolase family protein [Cohnella herbarum]|uniref:SGNH/GDSL hydrolase family protein n=1 Tax=Cohnella herbarum TaxID=2728023 RepID=A0A7Z2VMM3_9BACL|nr:SGNH/GDSL hydrolase family protein [Cohnella herbarum]QJD85854.1 SGNH/GDSL hydrolase family protein [Cohnella herbarum]